MPGNIFVSYRRDDSKHAAGRLVDRLLTKFGRDALFIDVDNIELGLDFRAVLSEKVEACEVMLVIIGPGWLSAQTETGEQRLGLDQDFVRIEVETALSRDIRVIPVLVDGAELPKAEELPQTLVPLAQRQATRLDHASFAADAHALTEALDRILNPPAPVQVPNPTPPPAPSHSPARVPPPVTPPEQSTTVSADPAQDRDIFGWFAAVSPALYLGVMLAAQNTPYLSVNDLPYWLATSPDQRLAQIPFGLGLMTIALRYFTQRPYGRWLKLMTIGSVLGTIGFHILLGT